MTLVQRLAPERTAVLIVDMQEKLLPVIHDHQQITAQVARLIDGAKALELPILVTEQYRKGLGVTVKSLGDRLENVAGCWEKMDFSACIEPVLNTLSELEITSVVVAGIESHVCILQSCLGLMEKGYVAAVAVDATGSRRMTDRDAAIQRMIQAGVIPTTVESVLLEITGKAGTARFKKLLPIIR